MARGAFELRSQKRAAYLTDHREKIRLSTSLLVAAERGVKERRG